VGVGSPEKVTVLDASSISLSAASILALADPALTERLAIFRAEQTASVATEPHDAA